MFEEGIVDVRGLTKGKGTQGPVKRLGLTLRFHKTEKGQRKFLEIRDNTHKLLKQSGAIRMENAMCGSGDSWENMACVDRMVELNEIREINQTCSVAGKHRIFVLKT